MGIYLRLLKYIALIKKEVMLKAGVGIAVTATHIIQAISMSFVIQGVWRRESVMSLMPGILFVSGMIFIRGILIRFAEGYNKVLGARIKSKMRLTILDKITDLGPSYITAERSGKLTSLVLDGIESLEPFYVNFVPQVGVVLAAGLGIFGYLAGLDPIGSVILLISMALCVLIPLVTVPLISKNVTDYWSEYSLITAEYIDSVQGMTTLKTLNAEKRQERALRGHADTFYQRSIRNTGISLINSAIMVILTAIISSLSVAFVAVRFSKGLVPAGAVTAFLFLAVECARPMMDLNRYWHASFLGLSIARDLFSLLEKTPSVEKRASDNIVYPAEPLNLAMDDVSFSYNDENEVLHHVKIEVPFGSTYAIVGPSGSGKSTLINLLLRFYDPRQGHVLLAGRDMKEYPLSFLYHHIAAVFQDTYLFYGTIEDNIRMSKWDADHSEIIQAAKEANAHEFIMNLPQGYQTMVGEHGITLSGGERQRLSLARAFLKQAPILLLDEATSSVDSLSEKLFQASVEKLAGKCTIIMVAHRLSTVRHADRILVMDKGRIVQEGTHEELLTEDGVYRRLIHAQEEIANEL